MLGPIDAGESDIVAVIGAGEGKAKVVVLDRIGVAGEELKGVTVFIDKGIVFEELNVVVPLDKGGLVAMKLADFETPIEDELFGET